MNSCFYECQIFHERFSPRRHRFLYRIFLFAIDLDELDLLHRQLAFFSVNRRNAYSFLERDFLPTSDESTNTASNAGHASTTAPGLKARVISYVAQRGIDLTGGRVVLVTLPRVFGYLFNPVSFYFCYDRLGAPIAALAEVTNTFKEVKPYLLGPETKQVAAAGGFHLRIPKFFYVSPYSDVDVAFDFKLRVPDEKLSMQIDDYADNARTLTSVLSGHRRELSNARLSWFTVKYPLITLKVITLIHWHALRLWLKRVPWFAKAARAPDQRELYRPHSSLRPVKISDLP